MTYCLAINMRSGLVFASDSRTNAGVDHIDSYSKMHCFSAEGRYCYVVLAAGNLGTTQAVISEVGRDLADSTSQSSLATVNYMFEAARYLGQVSRRVQNEFSKLNGQESKMEASFIIGGQIAGQPHDIYLVYPEGNYINASDTNPFLQIGELKYGKPILDRIITRDTTLEDAARCALVSLDSTMRSNVSVGPPVELSFYCKDALQLQRRIVLDTSSEFYTQVRERWSTGLKEVFKGLPRFEWEKRSG